MAINNNTIELIANLLVAFGTIFLAIVSYKNVKIIRKQTKLIFSQSNFLRLQQTPLLKTEDLEVNVNKISVKLTNIGKGIATQIGLDTGYYVVSPKLVEPPEEKLKEKYLREKGITKEEFKSVTKIFGRELWFKYHWNPHRELFKEVENKKILGLGIDLLKEISKAFPENYITFLKNVENNSSVLEEGKCDIFNCIPQMGLKVGEKYLMRNKYPKYSRFLSFEELLKLCKENDIQYLGFKIDLIYKDLAENIQMPEELINCIVNIRVHETLEDAVKENTKLDLFPLGQSDIEKKIGGTFKDFYKAKSFPNYISSFDEEY